jgi:hypothetical protein
VVPAVVDGKEAVEEEGAHNLAEEGEPAFGVPSGMETEVVR